VPAASVLRARNNMLAPELPRQRSAPALQFLALRRGLPTNPSRRAAGGQEPARGAARVGVVNAVGYLIQMTCAKPSSADPASSLMKTA
jgi:hypothetical protein